MAMHFKRYGWLLLLLCSLAWADSWIPPRQRQYVSVDGNVRVTVTPRALSGALPYFRDKVEGVEPAGQRKGRQARATAMLERKGADGTWRTVWTGPLVNDVSPVSALVANSGRLVTFDNWHSLGWGDDAVVIYDEHGKLVRKMALSDLLPAGYIVSLPRTVSSLHWGGGHMLIDGDRKLELRVAAPGSGLSGDKVGTVPLRIDLANGHLLPVQDRAWMQAQQEVAKLDRERRRRWDALRARRAAPLPVPTGTDRRTWREYMVELRERLNATTGEQHAGAVLPRSGQGDYPDSREAIAEMLQEAAKGREYAATHYLFVSPTSSALAALLAQQLRGAPAGSMRGIHISFVGTPQEGEALQTVAIAAGAQIRLIDKAAAYPGQTLPVEMPALFD